MKKLIALLIVTIIAALLVITCPDKKMHREAITTAISEIMYEKAASDSTKKVTGWDELGNMFVTKAADVFLSTNLTVKNYFVISVGEFHFGNTRRNISYGILNHVFTFDREDLEKAMEE